jgi:plasmid stabilization system protein ParE
MTGYEFHPQARVDLDEIWEYIAADNLDAADRVIAEILAAIRALIPFSRSGTQTPGPHLTAFALHSCTRILDCLCAGRNAVVGCCDHAPKAQPSDNGRDPQNQGAVSGQRAFVDTVPNHFNCSFE